MLTKYTENSTPLSPSINVRFLMPITSYMHQVTILEKDNSQLLANLGLKMTHLITFS